MRFEKGNKGYWLGKKRSKSTKIKISIAKKGITTRKNYKHSEETKKKISKNRKGKMMGKDNPGWKGGRTYSQGYVLLYKPNYKTSDVRGYIREHRYIMEKHLGRYLESYEVVHHINGIKDDNRLENLILFTRSTHTKNHHPNGPIPRGNTIQARTRA